MSIMIFLSILSEDPLVFGDNLLCERKGDNFWWEVSTKSTKKTWKTWTFFQKRIFRADNFLLARRSRSMKPKLEIRLYVNSTTVFFCIFISKSSVWVTFSTKNLVSWDKFSVRSRIFRNPSNFDELYLRAQWIFFQNSKRSRKVYVSTFIWA